MVYVYLPSPATNLVPKNPEPMPKSKPLRLAKALNLAKVSIFLVKSMSTAKMPTLCGFIYKINKVAHWEMLSNGIFPNLWWTRRDNPLPDLVPWMIQFPKWKHVSRNIFKFPNVELIFLNIFHEFPYCAWLIGGILICMMEKFQTWYFREIFARCFFVKMCCMIFVLAYRKCHMKYNLWSTEISSLQFDMVLANH